MSIGLRAVIITVVIAGSVGCSQDVSKSETKEVSTSEIKGACADVHKSQVCTWANMQGETLLEVGATVPIGAIENAPATVPMVWPPVPVATLDIPEVARQKSGINNLTMFWEASGHPTGAFFTPHFDFHFYMITPQEQSQVVPGADTIAVDPKYIPKNYVSGVMAVPDMGTHWVDTTSGEFHGQPFTITFIYGFYHGNMTFLEPMISKEFLLKKPDVILPIKQPQAFQHHG